MRLGSYYRVQILKHFNIKADSNCVLDVGGYDGYWLSSQEAKNKYVLDIEIIKKYKNVKYVKGNALAIPFSDNYFDQVFAFDVLEHVNEGTEQKFISELIRVCKKNGEIILSTPSKSIKIFPSFMTNYISRKWGHYKCNGYSKGQLNIFLAKYKNINFEVIENSAFNFRLFYFPNRFLWIISQKLVKKMLNLIAFLDAKNKRGIEGFYIVKILKK